MKPSEGCRKLCPAGVVTVMSTGEPVTVPEGIGGDVAVMVVSELTVKVAELPPKDTSVAPVNPEPVMVTVVPPAAGPELGLTEVTDGAEVPLVAVKVNRSADELALAPLGVWTWMSTVPAFSAGDTAVMDVSESTV